MKDTVKITLGRWIIAFFLVPFSATAQEVDSTFPIRGQIQDLNYTITGRAGFFTKVAPEDCWGKIDGAEGREQTNPNAVSLNCHKLLAVKKRNQFPGDKEEDPSRNIVIQRGEILRGPSLRNSSFSEYECIQAQLGELRDLFGKPQNQVLLKRLTNSEINIVLVRAENRASVGTPRVDIPFGSSNASPTNVVIYFARDRKNGDYCAKASKQFVSEKLDHLRDLMGYSMQATTPSTSNPSGAAIRGD